MSEHVRLAEKLLRVDVDVRFKDRPVTSNAIETDSGLWRHEPLGLKMR